MEYSSVTLGQTIRNIRKNKKISLKRLADITGYATHSLGNIERGSRNPSMQTFVDICNALEVSSDELLFDYLKVHFEYSTQYKLETVFSELTEEQQKKIMSIIEEIVK